MAYEQHNVTALTDIPPLVSTFAAANGFTVTGTSAAPIVKAGSGIAFQLTATISGFDHDLKWTAQSAPTVTSTARIRSPKLGGTAASPNTQIPSKLHIFGGQTPQPFIAIVVQYSDNLFRHLYYGYMEKLGAYTGGEVISGTSFYNSSTAIEYPISYREQRNQYLFSANQQGIALADCGGVMLTHASNAIPWRRFRGPSGSTPSVAWAGNEVLGGFKDDINDGYLARALSSYAGSNLLVPINLYSVQGVNDTATFVPVGRPAGVRAVNMRGIDPGTQLTIGSVDWRVFPAFSKSDSETVGVAAGGWGTGETSGMVGYAFQEG